MTHVEHIDFFNEIGVTGIAFGRIGHGLFMPNRGFNQIDDFAYVAVFKIVAGGFDRTATAVPHHHD